MKKLISITAAITVAFSLLAPVAFADPEADREAFVGYVKKKLQKVELADWKNGVYALDEDAKSQWEDMEEFPPYELQIDEGKEMWGKKFSNGKSYADCLGSDVSAIRGKYPFYDEEKDTIRTIEDDINNCREANGEKKLKNFKGKLASLSAYIAFEGRGSKINIAPPSEKAMKWYNKGKKFYYSKRGQLNMSCADCHLYYAGQKVRTELLGPGVGQTTHFPVYRSKWGELGTLHRRYKGCNKQVRAKPFKAQGPEYKALEYFHSYMSNGLEFNGPGSRK